MCSFLHHQALGMLLGWGKKGKKNQSSLNLCWGLSGLTRITCLPLLCVTHAGRVPEAATADRQLGNCSLPFHKLSVNGSQLKHRHCLGEC